ncbi:MAG: YchF/TatD family DNA exonuclease [Deltaproteobacteria bacterium]|nr:YchF/TatD family DNA exonuclease [Deltaproteobacteria bacterium]
MADTSAPLFDAHAHLDFDDFSGETDAVLARARAAGLVGIVTVGAGRGLDGQDAAVALAARHPDVWATVGIHPHDARQADETALARIRELAARPRVVAIGEIGLDYHYDHSPRPQQRQAFAAQLRLARELRLPIVVHTREAEDDTLAVLVDEGAAEVGGLLHCFSGGERLARAALSLGLHFSFSGVLTFPKADGLRDVARRVVPIERSLVETDAPFLAPVPLRGKRCEPAWVVHTAAKLAEVHGLSLEDVARITTRNARRLYRLEDPLEPRLAYPIRDSLYLNITNRCTLACTFCAKRSDWTVKGHFLKLPAEPSAAEMRAAIAVETARREFSEVVFCGFGESTLRLELLKELATEWHGRGRRIRLDTDGLADLVHGRDVAAELRGIVDAVSVSLNAPDAESHARLCPSRFGTQAWPAVVGFLRSARKHIGDVTATVVGLPGLDLEACRRLAEDDLGVRFRVRPHNVVG